MCCNCNVCCYSKNNFNNLREKWLQFESDSNDGCCCCRCKKKPLCRGRFGLAWISETSKNKCCHCKPCGWQIEFEGTPSKVDQTFKELTRWANNPPPPLYATIVKNDCCCIAEELNKKECGCECYLLTDNDGNGNNEKNVKSEENIKDVEKNNMEKKGNADTKKEKTVGKKENVTKDKIMEKKENHNYDNLTPLEKIRKAHHIRDEIVHNGNGSPPKK